jgi:hypothetical protein
MGLIFALGVSLVNFAALNVCFCSLSDYHLVLLYPIIADFEPKVGINEDPVSGWPHCALGPYFGVRRKKDRLFGLQQSDRTGVVECILKEDEQRVCIIGNTVITVSGRLHTLF